MTNRDREREREIGRRLVERGVALQAGQHREPRKDTRGAVYALRYLQTHDRLRRELGR